MRKTVWIFGLIAGFIVSALMLYSMARGYKADNFEGGLVTGYASMIVALSFIFVGIRNYRNNYNGGTISFGKAFKVGLFITLIASTIYVLAWMVDYYLFIPDFMEKYGNHMMQEAKAENLNPADLEKKTQEIAMYKNMYKNPVFVALFTYLEILPVGLIISVIAALILKRKSPSSNVVAEA